MEDGQTLFDYNVGLNDIVQLLIRSQTDPPDSHATKDSSGVACSSGLPLDSRSESHNSPAPASPAAMEISTNIDNDSSSVTTNTVNETKPDTSATSNSSSTKNGFKSSSPARDTQPPTSSRNTLVNPGIGVYKVRMRVFLKVYARFCMELVRLLNYSLNYRAFNALRAKSLPEILGQALLCILCSTAPNSKSLCKYEVHIISVLEMLTK